MNEILTKFVADFSTVYLPHILDVLKEGTSVLCVGMGTVFTFLCILILAMILMSKAVAKINTIWPEPVPQVTGGGKKKASSGDDSEIAAAIVAAMFKK